MAPLCTRPDGSRRRMNGSRGKIVGCWHLVGLRDDAAHRPFDVPQVRRHYFEFVEAGLFVRGPKRLDSLHGGCDPADGHGIIPPSASDLSPPAPTPPLASRGAASSLAAPSSGGSAPRWACRL